MLRVREIALQNFSEQNIRLGRPMAKLEEVLVPIYLLHRFQIEAVGKLLGGQYFNYNVRGDRQALPVTVSAERQESALDALLKTLDPTMLRLPDELLPQITPRPPNNPKSREAFGGSTGHVFDPIAPAASAAALTLDVLLDPARAARLSRSGAPGFMDVTTKLLDATWLSDPAGGTTGAIQRQTNMQVLHGLLQLAYNIEADSDVRAVALQAVSNLDNWLDRQSTRDGQWKAHYQFAQSEIKRLQDGPGTVGATGTCDRSTRLTHRLKQQQGLFHDHDSNRIDRLPWYPRSVGGLESPRNEYAVRLLPRRQETAVLGRCVQH